ncbi:SCO6745 family protein [Mycobacterium avium]|uniref:SCO6745 family protein n=1 Tax=Mycobacterium avium TaxID=1764 RepID=UPI001CC396EA|nr:hypothetical protein [Mycobacterium avium]MBZ4622085.1 hypothetical protein [Mycobacterium avium subsp. hominissuis]
MVAIPIDDQDTVNQLTRRLRARVEPILGLVFQAPEARAGGLGLNPIQWYMAGRAAPMGAIAPLTAASLFAPLNPRFVERGLAGAWDRVTPEQIIDARLASAAAMLEPIADACSAPLAQINDLLQPIATVSPITGAPLYAGLLALPWPTSPFSVLLRCCDLIREHRGDMHNLAWLATGLDPAQINVLSELWKNAALGSVTVKQMGFSKGDAERALHQLEHIGLAHDGVITPAGMTLRDSIELETSLLQTTLARRLEPCSDQIFDLLTPISQRCHDMVVAYWDR